MNAEESLAGEEQLPTVPAVTSGHPEICNCLLMPLMLSRKSCLSCCILFYPVASSRRQPLLASSVRLQVNAAQPTRDSEAFNAFRLCLPPPFPPRRGQRILDHQPASRAGAVAPTPTAPQLSGLQHDAFLLGLSSAHAPSHAADGWLAPLGLGSITQLHLALLPCRAALEEERQRQQGATRLVSTTAVEGGAPVGMETDESDVQAAATQAAAAVAGVAAQAATGLKSPQRCSAAYALF